MYAVGGGGVSHGEVYTCPGTSAERLVVAAHAPDDGDDRGGGTETAAASGSWSYTASMATPRHALATVAMPETNSIYAIGGWISPHCTAAVERYDPSADTWVECASLHTARRLHRYTIEQVKRISDDESPRLMSPPNLFSAPQSAQVRSTSSVVPPRMPMTSVRPKYTIQPQTPGPPRPTCRWVPRTRARRWGATSTWRCSRARCCVTILRQIRSRRCPNCHFQVCCGAITGT